LPEKKVLFVPQPPLVNPLPSEGVVYPKKYNLVYAGNVGNLQLIENYVKACMLSKESFGISSSISSALALGLAWS
jgi:hypothetical protein